MRNKIKFIFIISFMIFALSGCNKEEAKDETTEMLSITSTADLLNNVWDTFSEDEKFSVMGGDYENSVENGAGIFNIEDVLETPCDKLEIDAGNINDLTNLLTLGIVRFINTNDRSDVLEVPFRLLWLLYRDANVLGVENDEKFISFKELDTFSVIDGTVRNDLFVFSAKINEPSVDLRKVMEIAYEYGNYGMNEKIKALEEVDDINHRRIISDEKERTLYNKY